MLLRQLCHHLSRFPHGKDTTLRVQRLVKFKIHSAVLRSLKQQQKSQETTAWAKRQKELKSTVHYVVAAAVLAVGLSYAAVPLYRMFCQVCFVSVNRRITCNNLNDTKPGRCMP
jgi:hypothetical protein